ncbi:hypothetical protein QQP08_004455 [Theobroma cacao]|nr:hypothetical protein QQP08_004455 [Theobroma cacao]
MEPSLGGKQQIESELDILGQHHDRKSAKSVHPNQISVGIPDVPHQIKLNCVTTPDKGRGMASQFEFPETIGVESHLQAHELNDIDIKKVAHISLDETCSSLRIDSEYCLKCGSYCNLASMSEAVKKAWVNLRRLQDSITLKDMHGTELSDALRSVGILRSMLHAYNKGIGEAEDNLAQAFCFTGDLQPARDHCKASIEVPTYCQFNWRKLENFIFLYMLRVMKIILKAAKPVNLM